jgi:heptosyltransferase III
MTAIAPGKRGERTALLASNALGDTLVSMVIAHNLVKSGARVVVFGAPAYALRDWFPELDIRPLPEEPMLAAVLAPYDRVLQMHAHQPKADLPAIHPHVRILEPITLGDEGGCMAHRFAEFCRSELGLLNADIGNGLSAPASLQHRRYRQRVAIHPEASTADKRWSSKRFVDVAVRLQQRGYEVNFLIAPDVRERWAGLERWNIGAPSFDDLDTLAAWLYECGWFIGNDSGIGHLASNLGIPTLSLFRRRRVSERWQPAWGAVEVVLPWQWVPTAGLKEKFWRETLTCGRVLSAFLRMVEADRRDNAPPVSDERENRASARSY